MPRHSTYVLTTDINEQRRTAGPTTGTHNAFADMGALKVIKLFKKTTKINRISGAFKYYDRVKRNVKGYITVRDIRHALVMWLRSSL